FRQTAQHRMVADLTVDFRGRDADAPAEDVQTKFVIDDGEALARVVVEDTGSVAAGHAQDSQLVEAAGGSGETEHTSSIPKSFVLCRWPGTNDQGQGTGDERLKPEMAGGSRGSGTAPTICNPCSGQAAAGRPLPGQAFRGSGRGGRPPRTSSGTGQCSRR